MTNQHVNLECTIALFPAEAVETQLRIKGIGLLGHYCFHQSFGNIHLPANGERTYLEADANAGKHVSVEFERAIYGVNNDQVRCLPEQMQQTLLEKGNEFEGISCKIRYSGPESEENILNGLRELIRKEYS